MDNAPRSRLGRGISALMGGDLPPANPASPAAAAPADAKPSTTPATVPLASIDVNPRQPRRTFDEAALDELAASVKANGVIQPLVVRPVGDRYELIAGERRFRAARKAGLERVPVIVHAIDDYTQAQWALVENIHREDLNPLERAEAYAALMRDLNLTQTELAGRLGEQRSSVANYLRLLDLAEPVRDLVRTGSLSLGHAKVLAGVSDNATQISLAGKCAEEHWSVRELERVAAELTAAPVVAESADAESEPPTPVADAHFAELEQQLVQHLGVRVKLRRGRKSGTGQIVLHYASLDQFDDLVRRWGISLRDD